MKKKMYWVPLVYDYNSLSNIKHQIEDPNNIIEELKKKAHEYSVATYGIYEHWLEFGKKNRDEDLDTPYGITIIVGGKRENVTGFCEEIIKEFGRPKKPRPIIDAFDLWMGEGNIRGRKLLREIIDKKIQE
ncbi:MAG: hypothetical protein J7L45_01385 [Candidatus Aenigmarchaeota archaeon]|nr:hypothetical protein [Candidatus Aenigmarchaeota archaeon]